MGGWAGIHGQESTLPLGFLRFLRDFELEADRLAAQIMARAGYAPTALARYIERMQVSSTDRPNLYSPLPSREARLTALRQAIAELPAREFPAGSGEFERIQKDVRTIVEGARAAPSQP